ncbi:hypothetical protein SAMN05660841_03033 [Sphingobacterium nematocida]|uniref:Uncharacterized protein n=1 Tax=Sphingobacterium nematocida TaxID=1513896 RepID=A0A1T5F4V8_9SPHI|nr:hypothetical protein SAMN05660841_03033 [Sphingobacterium nematocida]
MAYGICRLKQLIVDPEKYLMMKIHRNQLPVDKTYMLIVILILCHQSRINLYLAIGYWKKNMMWLHAK